MAEEDSNIAKPGGTSAGSDNSKESIPPTAEASASSAPEPQENLFWSLILNIAIPSAILILLPERLGANGPKIALLLGLAFPISYGIYHFIRAKKVSFFAVLGFAAVLLTGGLELFEAPAFWFAIKEAAVPLIMALAILFSLKIGKPLVEVMLLSPRIIDRPLVDARLKEKGTEKEFHKLLVGATWWLAAAMVLSSILNFVLARIIINSPPNTPERVKELGQMNLWTWPVITIPVTAVMLWAMLRSLNGMSKLTGMELDDIFHPDIRAKADAAEAKREEKKRAREDAQG